MAKSPDRGPSGDSEGNIPDSKTSGDKNLGDVPAQSLSRGFSPSKESPGHTPVKRASRGNSPSRESLTHAILPRSYSIRKDGSPGRMSQKKTQSLTAPAAVPKKKKLQSGHTTPRDASPNLIQDEQKSHVSFTNPPDKNRTHSPHKSPRVLSPDRENHEQHLQMVIPASPKTILKPNSGERHVSPVRNTRQQQAKYPTPGPNFWYASFTKLGCLPPLFQLPQE
ncbi:hypothetical protein R1flu_026535 [Riccia fluitans]|uniref:Uncharacterized protein n=1 Tax=Riccia fluitans TaxID=41844 RepID=A0ABD1XG89_9MARC